VIAEYRRIGAVRKGIIFTVWEVGDILFSVVGRNIALTSRDGILLPEHLYVSISVRPHIDLGSVPLPGVYIKY